METGKWFDAIIVALFLVLWILLLVAPYRLSPITE